MSDVVEKSHLPTETLAPEGLKPEGLKPEVHSSESSDSLFVQNDGSAPDADDGVAPLPSGQDVGLSGPHFGHVLEAQRKRLGLSQAEIAARLRLHIKQVVALEAADFSGLPELTFIRGYLRNYARTLGLDEQPLLEDLRQRAQVVAAPQVASNVVEDRAWMSTSHGSTLSVAKEWLMSRRALVAVVLGVVLILAGVSVVASRKSPEVKAVSATATGTASVEASVAPVLPSTASASSSAPSGTLSPDIEALAKEAALAAAQTSATSGTLPASMSGPTTLRLTFRERSWAEVAQGDGRIVLSQVIEPGSARQFSGQPPYRVLIGNASVVAVQWRGRAVDLKPYTSFENVARLTLE